MHLPPLEILYEDNHLLIVFKPAGVPTQADKTRDPSLLEMAKDYIAAKYHKKGQVYLGLVHRLDRPVAGVVLLARTSKAASRLSAQFREGDVKKTYLALVTEFHGPAHQELISYLSPGAQNKVVVSDAQTPGSKRAQLTYTQLPRRHPAYPEGTFLDVTLQTGRKHQIRAQLAHQGFPIVGDRKYGSRVPLQAGRIALLGRELTVHHPISAQPVCAAWTVPENWPKAMSPRALTS